MTIDRFSEFEGDLGQRDPSADQDEAALAQILATEELRDQQPEPQVAPAPAPQVAVPIDPPAPQAPPQQAPPPQEQMVPISRLNAVAADRDRYRDNYEQTVRGMINRPAPAPQAPPQPQEFDVPLPDGVDPEFAKLVRPGFEKAIVQARQEGAAEAINVMESRYGPGLQHANREANIAEVERRVPGFKDQLFEQAESMWRGLPQQERDRLNAMGAEGMELMAHRVRSSVEQQPQAPAPPVGMAHSAPTGDTPPDLGGQWATEQQVWSAPGEQFDALIEQVMRTPI